MKLISCHSNIVKMLKLTIATIELRIIIKRNPRSSEC